MQNTFGSSYDFLSPVTDWGKDIFTGSKSYFMQGVNLVLCQIHSSHYFYLLLSCSRGRVLCSELFFIPACPSVGLPEEGRRPGCAHSLRWAGAGTAHSTLSLGKGFGSKGKQHYKHTASETQTHNQWFHKTGRKSWNFPQVAETMHNYHPDHHWPLST